MTTDPTPSAETAKPTRSLLSKPIPLAIGVGVVALLVGGGAGFGISQLTHDNPSTTSNATLTLPSTLSGGFTRNATIDAQLKTSVSSAVATLGAGTDMALYTSGTNRVLVEATRVGGGATLSAGMTYAKVGADVCASTSTTSGSEAICTRTAGALMIEVTATDQTTAAKYTDEVYKAIA